MAPVPAEEETSGKLSVSEISVSFGGIIALDGVSLEVDFPSRGSCSCISGSCTSEWHGFPAARNIEATGA